MNGGKHSPRIRFLSDKFRSSLFLAISIGILILQAIGCDKGQEQATSPTEDEALQQVLQHFSTNHTEAGIMKWSLVGNSAKFMKDVVKVQHPEVQIYQDGKVAITITGDRGNIIRTSNDIQVFGNVVGSSQDGKLYTDELHWRNQDGKLYAPNESKIVRGDSTLVGKEMEGDPSLEVVTMKKIQFEIYPKKDEGVDVSKQ